MIDGINFFDIKVDSVIVGSPSRKLSMLKSALDLEVFRLRYSETKELSFSRAIRRSSSLTDSEGSRFEVVGSEVGPEGSSCVVRDDAGVGSSSSGTRDGPGLD